MNYSKNYIAELIEVLELFSNDETLILSHKLLKKFISKYKLKYSVERPSRLFLYEKEDFSIAYDIHTWDSITFNEINHISFNSDSIPQEHREKDVLFYIEKIKSYEIHKRIYYRTN